jgi:tRNA1(Val) A37 N6-methylase TrmN6
MSRQVDEAMSPAAAAHEAAGCGSVMAPRAADPALPFTEDHLLGGRVGYAQPRHGFRSGIEPVLLAAAVPARPGERVLEGGTGAGAGLLCLAARVRGIQGVGIERDATIAALARRNALANGWDRLSFVVADVERWDVRGADAQGSGTGSADMEGRAGRQKSVHIDPACGGETLVPTGFDHAFANPPYHPEGGTASPLRALEAAKRRHGSLLTDWTAALAAGLRHRGTLTLILPAEALPQTLAAMQAARCPARAVLPLWPKSGMAAKLLLVQGVKGGRSPLRLLSGLTLHAADGRFTPEAEAILRDAAPLSLA